MTNVQPSTTKFINAANGAKLTVKCSGILSVCVNGNDIDIKNVLCVPEVICFMFDKIWQQSEFCEKWL